MTWLPGYVYVNLNGAAHVELPVLSDLPRLPALMLVTGLRLRLCVSSEVWITGISETTVHMFTSKTEIFLLEGLINMPGRKTNRCASIQVGVTGSPPDN